MKQGKEEKYYFQKGGATRFPNRYFNADATPFQPCACAEQHGGGAYPYRYFHADATPFQPCDCGCNKANCGCKKQTGGCGCAMGYYNDFKRHQGMHGYNSDNMTDGAASYNQNGGNPTHAPLHVFKDGAPLTYNFRMKDNFTGAPAFDHVGLSKFW